MRHAVMPALGELTLSSGVSGCVSETKPVLVTEEAGMTFLLGARLSVVISKWWAGICLISKTVFFQRQCDR